MTVKLGLVDDHRLFREGLRALLSTQPDFQLVGEASQAQDAYALVDQAQPDVLLLDVSLPAVPYVQVHWRDETPRVGGGTVAEFIVRVIQRDCAGSEVSRAIAYGFGRDENMQVGANWPSEDDFSPGVGHALDNLCTNLTDLFRDVAMEREVR